VARLQANNAVSPAVLADCELKDGGIYDHQTKSHRKSNYGALPSTSSTSTLDSKEETYHESYIQRSKANCSR
jgi:hypothetical protein